MKKIPTILTKQEVRQSALTDYIVYGVPVSKRRDKK